MTSRRPGPVASGIHLVELSHGPCVARRHARRRASTMCFAVQRADGASACSNTIPFPLPFPRSTRCGARWKIKFYIWSSADRSHRTHKLDILPSAHHSRGPAYPTYPCGVHNPDPETGGGCARCLPCIVDFCTTAGRLCGHPRVRATSLNCVTWQGCA